MKDYLYYLIDERMDSEELVSVKETLCAKGAKVICILPSKEAIRKALKSIKGPKKYALVVGNTVESAIAAQKAKTDFCGILDESTHKDAFSSYPYRQLLSDIKLLPLLGQPYPYKNYGWFLNKLITFSRLIHFKQIRGLSHKAKHNVNEFVCQNCGETYSGNYCPTCGQTHKVKRFEVTTIAKEFVSEAMDIEHGFLRSFLELFWRPGYMMRDYLNGRRKDYNKPFKAIFVLATVYLIAAHLLDPASFGNKERELGLGDIPTISQKLAADSTNQDIFSHLNQIANLSKEALAIKREEGTIQAELMADSIIKSQSTLWKMSTEDSLFVINRVKRGLSRSEDQKLSEVFADEEELPGIMGWMAKLSIRNMEVVEKFQAKYYHEGTLLYSMVDLVEDFFDMNKAVTIVLMIPVMVFCARRSFRTTLVGMKLNLAEYIVVFTHFGSQLMWLQLFSLFTTQQADFNPLMVDMGTGFMLLTWDMKQLFNLGWKNAFKRTVFYMYGYGILFAFILTLALSLLGSFVMWVLYQIT